MATEYGKWIREPRTMHCPKCDATVDTMPVRQVNGGFPGEMRRCEDGHEFFTPDTWVTGAPKDADRWL
jgi:hypothetical protein